MPRDALSRIVAQTQGYPYFIQEWGMQCWDVAVGPTITLQDVEAATVLVIAALDEGPTHQKGHGLEPQPRGYGLHGTASTLGASADPFLMAVAIGASCAFLTDRASENTLILGPGGFRFGDYWKLGLPLEIIAIAVSLPMLLLVWPI